MLKQMTKILPARAKLYVLAAIAIYSFTPTAGFSLLTAEICEEKGQFIAGRHTPQDARGRGRALCNALVAEHVTIATLKTGTTNACNNLWDKLSYQSGNRGTDLKSFCQTLMIQGIFPKQ